MGIEIALVDDARKEALYCDKCSWLPYNACTPETIESIALARHQEKATAMADWARGRVTTRQAIDPGSGDSDPTYSGSWTWYSLQWSDDRVEAVIDSTAGW